MITRYDVAVIGAGFGGSLMALILKRMGLQVVLFDSGRHPRFAIGESSTPIADMILRDLSATYDLPQFAPLTKYGTWIENYPELTCGLKRGFSYFFHQPGQQFATDENHSRELLVAASSNDVSADTHWLRSDVDRFFIQQVEQTGIAYFDQTSLSAKEEAFGWRLEGTRTGSQIRCCAKFLIDASGGGRFLQHQLEIQEHSRTLITNSRSIYAHFENLIPWEECLHHQLISTAEHPFCCDDAALHHMIEAGWMWQLRFRNGITSCGIMLDNQNTSNASTLSPEAEWNAILQRYPSIHRQFQNARAVQPETGLFRTSRLQRLCSKTVGDNWAMLPNTAGFVDPLHSTGIAHTLSGVERLAKAFEHRTETSVFGHHLQQYEQALFKEFELIDKLIAGCYRAPSSQHFMTYSMLYFAAATTYEARRTQGEGEPSFLCAADSAWQQIVDDVFRTIADSSNHEAFQQRVAQSIHAYNQVGLCDPTVRNMYRYTVASK